MTDRGTLFETPMHKAARISECGHYRYVLLRRWRLLGPRVTFIMLNPSTADAEVDDPTIRRCVGFARAWGMSAVHVVNLYGWRATNPRELRTVPDPVGPENDRYLAQCAWAAHVSGWPLVAAWGAGASPERVAAVLALPGMQRLTALGVTKAGQPRHPLYLPATSERTPWPS